MISPAKKKSEKNYALYVVLSNSAGISVIATSNLAWILSRTSRSAWEDTNVNARPFVPKRPARLERIISVMSITKGEPRWRHVPNAMQVRVSISRRVIVDDNVNALNVNTPSEDVRCDQYPLLKVFELLITRDTKEVESTTDQEGKKSVTHRSS